jgi:hypothetical protein
VQRPTLQAATECTALPCNPCPVILALQSLPCTLCPALHGCTAPHCITVHCIEAAAAAGSAAPCTQPICRLPLACSCGLGCNLGCIETLNAHTCTHTHLVIAEAGCCQCRPPHNPPKPPDTHTPRANTHMHPVSTHLVVAEAGCCPLQHWCKGDVY